MKAGQGYLATEQYIALLKTDIDQLKSDIILIKWSMAAMIAIMLGGFSIIAS